MENDPERWDDAAVAAAYARGSIFDDSDSEEDTSKVGFTEYCARLLHCTCCTIFTHACRMHGVLCPPLHSRGHAVLLTFHLLFCGLHFGARNYILSKLYLSLQAVKDIENGLNKEGGSPHSPLSLSSLTFVSLSFFRAHGIDANR